MWGLAGELYDSGPIAEGYRQQQQKLAFVIGSYEDGSHLFLGQLAHLAVFEVALTPDQAQAVMNVRVP